MIRNAIQEYFFFGTVVRYLQDAEHGYSIKDVPAGRAVRSNLELLFANIERLNLNVTARTDAATSLRHLLDEFSGADDAAVLSREQAQSLRRLITELRATLQAELRSTYSYTVTPKRVDVLRLLEAPESLLAPGTFAKLPEIARYDLTEAARCIAFELPTSAAFHLMRATEAVLRGFYAALVRRGGRAVLWGPIVVDLRRRRSAKHHATLLNHLDHIRAAFRNPTQHPDARYDIEQVQDLWALCVDVINRMSVHL